MRSTHEILDEKYQATMATWKPMFGHPDDLMIKQLLARMKPGMREEDVDGIKSQIIYYVK